MAYPKKFSHYSHDDLQSLQKLNLENLLNSYLSKGMEIPQHIRDCCVAQIQETIEKALRYVDEKVTYELYEKMTSCQADTLIIGDVHGELRLFIQILYIAGVIDIKGNYTRNPIKNIIQLGDMIDREGTQPFEAFVYIRALQKQIKHAGGQLHLLFGNHEKFALQKEEWWNENHFKCHNSPSIIMRPTLKNILLHDIKNSLIKLTYHLPKTNLLCFHGYMSKDGLLEIIANMVKDEVYQHRMNSNSTSKEYFKKLFIHFENSGYHPRVSLEELQNYLFTCKIGLGDISQWMNQCLVKYIQDPQNTHIQFLIHENKGVYNRNTYLYKKPAFDIDFSRYNQKYSHLPIQVGGHTPTTTQEECRRAKGFGFGILQDRSSLFADVDLCNGFQGFIAADSIKGDIFAVEIMDTDEAGKSWMMKDSLKGPEPNESFCYLPDKLQFIHSRKIHGIHLTKPNTSNCI